MEKSLKHWGIFGMKWGVRRFQNPDGSLTPAGRERYGVGSARGSENIGINMTDDELRKMTRRYESQARFYKARNDYIQAQNIYAQLVKKPPSFIEKFTNKYFIQPLDRTMQSSTEFAIRATSAALVESAGGKYAEDYVKYILKSNNNDNNNSNNNHNNHNNHNNSNNNHNNNNNKKGRHP